MNYMSISLLGMWMVLFLSISMDLKYNFGVIIIYWKVLENKISIK